jgi:hypothetical protein
MTKSEQLVLIELASHVADLYFHVANVHAANLSEKTADELKAIRERSQYVRELVAKIYSLPTV